MTEKQEKVYFFKFFVNFIDFNSKIAAFVKKFLPFSEYKDFYQIVNQMIQGHIFWSGLYFQAAKCKTGGSNILLGGIVIEIFKKYHPLYSAYFLFDCYLLSKPQLNHNSTQPNITLS